MAVLDDKTLLRRARKDLAKGLNADQARFLVDYYYAIQDFRIRADGQVRAVDQGADEGTFEIGTWLSEQTFGLEEEIKHSLDAWSKAKPVGVWAHSIHGIGPVIAAGLLAHIDITRAPTVGHIWSYAGLNPDAKWNKGEKRPWNHSLKVLCWKIGDSFVKQRNRPNDMFGKVYEARKAQEIDKNLRGVFADQAANTLATKKIRDKETRAVYEAGRLPDGRIDLRARRYATKLFLSAYHEAAFFAEYGRLPVKPYAIEHLGHVHYKSPPNMHVIEGWAEARAAAGL